MDERWDFALLVLLVVACIAEGVAYDRLLDCRVSVLDHEIMKPKPPKFRVAAYVVSCAGHCEYSARIEPVDDRFTLPSACPTCRGRLQEEPEVEILNLEDYPGGLDGIHVRVHGDDQSVRRGRYERRVVKETYAETGEPFEYDRRFFRDLNLYHKTYTNLATGEVAVDSTEPLTDHQGHGAAKRRRDSDDD